MGVESIKIGVTSDSDKYIRGSLSGIPRHLIQVIQKHSITPIAIPIVNSQEAVDLVSDVDGLIVKGGTDVNPMLYDQRPLKTTDPADPKRDRSEFAAIEAAITQKKPVLGICRGMQAINVMLGGSLYQDIYRQFPDSENLLNHTADWDNSIFPTHYVITKEGTIINQILGPKALINSRHHQAAKELGQGLIVGAHATDGIVEEIETSDGMIQGVQWHPEDLWKVDPKEEKLFTDFFERVKK